MKITPKVWQVVREVRKVTQAHDLTVSEAEGVYMLLLWSALSMHGTYESLDVDNLARDQLEAFMEYARGNLTMAIEH